MKEHNRLITAAAKAVLQPEGFRQKGRSRVWFADRGYWLTVIEFQPSSWSRGSYLNVAMHWLWGRPPHDMTFDRMERLEEFVEFESEVQFEPLAIGLAKSGLEAAKRDLARFSSVGATAEILIAEEEGREVHKGGWAAYNAGVAAALAGRFEDAQRMLASVQDPRVAPSAAPLAGASPQELTERISALVSDERGHFGLPPMEGECWRWIGDGH